MLKPPDTIASARAAVRVARVMPPLRAAGMSLPTPFCGGGWGGVIAGVALMAVAVTTGLRFLRYLAWRWALVGSLALGRSSVMLSVICAPSLPRIVEAGGAELAVAHRVLDVSVAEIRL